MCFLFSVSLTITLDVDLMFVRQREKEKDGGVQCGLSAIHRSIDGGGAPLSDVTGGASGGGSH